MRRVHAYQLAKGAILAIDLGGDGLLVVQVHDGVSRTPFVIAVDIRGEYGPGRGGGGRALLILRVAGDDGEPDGSVTRRGGLLGHATKIITVPEAQFNHAGALPQKRAPS